MPTARADLRLSSTSDLPGPGAHVTGLDLVAQRIRVRLCTWLGEYLLDARKGIPFRDWLQAKPFPLDIVATWVRREIEQTPGVTRATLTGSSFDEATGEASVDLDVVCPDGVVSVSVSPTLAARGNRSPGVITRVSP